MEFYFILSFIQNRFSIFFNIIKPFFLSSIFYFHILYVASINQQGGFPKLLTLSYGFTTHH